MRTLLVEPLAFDAVTVQVKVLVTPEEFSVTLTKEAVVP